VDAILEILQAMQPDQSADPNEGLRERKKRRVRQQISDVATAMFLVHGFDKVTVARIAAACEVSEQTVFNYFPTKESMLFDRAETKLSAVADAVRERGSHSLVDAVAQALGAGIQPDPRGVVDEARQLHLLRLFWETTGSPTLAGARLADFARVTDEIALALAQRVGADPTNPEVQLATFVIAGLIRVRQQSAFHHIQRATSLAALKDAISRDFHRAVQLAEPTLSAFDNRRPSRRQGARLPSQRGK